MMLTTTRSKINDMRHHHHIISTTTAADEAFFNRYEAMVSQQDAEEKSSVGHLRPLFDHLVYLLEMMAKLRKLLMRHPMRVTMTKKE
eukprot:14580490-Ditylum_brightwellii.AAC.1